jgi:hypothetical protein
MLSYNIRRFNINGQVHKLGNYVRGLVSHVDLFVFKSTNFIKIGQQELGSKFGLRHACKW